MAESPSALRRISAVLLVIAVIVVVASYPATLAVDRLAGREVVLLPVAAFDEVDSRGRSPASACVAPPVRT